MKNAFDGLISRLDMAEERISELEDIAVETSKTEKERKRDRGKKDRMSTNCETTKKVYHMQKNKL